MNFVTLLSWHTSVRTGGLDELWVFDPFRLLGPDHSKESVEITRECKTKKRARKTMMFKGKEAGSRSKHYEESASSPAL